ncbi:NUDIX domain-containing protein [Kitasatospora sp. GAS1066B]|uniref:NUDIX hydrolase n=1 Tax=Kitasatospora sp. GAS1066B TaxID=3156271 RepID=UPI003516388B
MTYRTVIGVHLVLIEEGRVLLGLRRSAAYADKTWHTPAGHLEHGESVAAGAAREAKEELGIVIDPADLELVHTLHDLDADDGAGRLQLFFRPARYTGEVTNAEPDKCHRLQWWTLDALPEPVVGYTVQALAAIAAGEPLSVRGFSA